MTRTLRSWTPAAILALGLVLVQGVSEQKNMPLREPLAAAVPAEIEGFASRDIEISEEEQRVAGMSTYVMRVYEAGAVPAFSVYVGYYDSQMQGKTIHSPKNCLPGAGWDALGATTTRVATASGDVTVNQYVIQRGTERALVLYWYQGRGRVESDEYAVKWHLLRDAALHRRSDEALVRVVVPITRDEPQALAVATSVASQLMPAVDRALPTW
jgi:EpsI family protein